MKSKISITIDNSLMDDIDSIVDNIFIRNRSQAIEHLVRSSIGENKVAVVLAGGIDNNKKIYNDEFRATVKIGKFSVIEKLIKKLRENSFKTIFIVGMGDILTRIFEILKDGTSYGVKINYIEEKTPKGSAATLRLLKGKITSRFLVVFADLLIDKIRIEEIWKDHLRQNPLATLMMTTSNEPSKKGTLVVEGTRILKFTQMPSKSDIYLVFSPIFIAEPEIFDYSGDSLENDVFPVLAEKGLLNGHLSSEKEIHIHNKEDVLRLEKKYH